MTTTINMPEAESNLSRLVDAVGSGAELEIVIARNGRPAARLVRVYSQNTGHRIGVAKGQFIVPESIDADAAEIAAIFGSISR